MSTEHAKAITVASTDTILKAFNRTYARVVHDKPASAATSAGFILTGKRGQRQGYQVFVKLIAFRETKLIKNPKSGGLLAKL